MDEQQAMDVILKLSDGIDPDSGEKLPPDSVCHRPAVIRALFAAVLALKYQAKYKDKDTA